MDRFNLYLCCCFLVAIALGQVCDLKHLEALSKGLKYDSTSLSECQQIIAQLDGCENRGSELGQRLFNQLSYKAGIIQLSLNQDLNAISSFERVSGSQDSFSQLSQKRLHKLYVEYGMWDKIDLEDEVRREFAALNGSVHAKWDATHDLAEIEPELQRLLELSPYSFELREFYLEALLTKLASSMDLSIAHDIIRNNELLLDKYSSRISLDRRLNMHYSSAVVQAFILNVEPTHLRRCLALDMDYEPCRALSILQNRLKKINPPRSQVLDPEIYASSPPNAVDWEKVVRFYLEDRKPCVKPPKGYKFENNYNLIKQLAAESMKKLFTVQKAPLKITLESQKFIDIMLCQAATETHSKMMEQLCKASYEEIVTVNTRKQIQKLSKGNQRGLEPILTDIWNTYPHLALYVTQNILGGSKNLPVTVQDDLHQFFHDNKLQNSNNKLIQKQYSVISGMKKERQRKYQQQQQQQQWNFYNQQQQNQRQAPVQNSPRTDRDYYKILGIPKTANSKEIRRAYLDFTKKYHPDKQGQLSEEEEKKIHEKMSQINEAYETLSDESKRKEYDRARSGGPSGGGPINPNMFRQAKARGGPSQFGKNFKMNFGFGYR